MEPEVRIITIQGERIIDCRRHYSVQCNVRCDLEKEWLQRAAIPEDVLAAHEAQIIANGKGSSRRKGQKRPAPDISVNNEPEDAFPMDVDQPHVSPMSPATQSPLENNQLALNKSRRCGLQNLGNTCFMNSALQFLRSVEELKNSILVCDTQLTVVNAEANTLLKALIMTFREMERLPQFAPNSILEALVNSNTFFGNLLHDAQGDQHDAKDCLQCIIENTTNPNDVSAVGLEQFFGGSEEVETTRNAFPEPVFAEPVVVLELGLGNRKGHLADFIRQRQVTRLYRKTYTEREVNGVVDRILDRTFVQERRLSALSDYLIFQLKRFINEQTKNNVVVEYPKFLDIKEFCTPNLAQQLEAENAVFELISVIAHSGQTAQYGHYMAYCKETTNSGSVWVCYDDSVVTELHESKVADLKGGKSCDAAAILLLYKKRTATSNFIINQKWETKTQHELSVPVPGTSKSTGLTKEGISYKLNQKGKKSNVHSEIGHPSKACPIPAPSKKRRKRKPSLKVSKKRRTHSGAETLTSCDSAKTHGSADNNDDCEVPDPQEEINNLTPSRTDFPQRKSLWEENRTFPLTAENLSVWNVGDKSSCSFLFQQHWVENFPDVDSDEWMLMRKELMGDFIKLNMGELSSKKKSSTKTIWRCRQCCCSFKRFNGFQLHVGCHHFPLGLMTEKEKQTAALFCTESHESLEARGAYTKQVTLLRTQYLMDCYREGVVDKDFNVLKAAKVGNIFRTWARKRGLRIPEISKLKSTLLFPDLKHVDWNMYRVKNWKFTRGSAPLNENTLQIAAESTWLYIKQRKMQAEKQGKIYTLVLLPKHLVSLVNEVYLGDLRHFLLNYNGYDIKEPLIVIIGKCSTVGKYSKYHFAANPTGTSYTRQLIETGDYLPYLVSSQPFKTDVETSYQEALAKEELIKMLYVKLCVNYNASRNNSRIKFVDHQQLEICVLRKLLEENLNAVKEIMDEVCENNGQIFGPAASQIGLQKSVPIKINQIKLRDGKLPHCSECGYVCGTTRDKNIHEFFHKESVSSLAGDSSLDELFSVPCALTNTKECKVMSEKLEKWFNGNTDEKQYYCYLLALDELYENDSDNVFQRLERFVSDRNYRKEHANMFHFYAGKNSTLEDGNSYHFETDTTVSSSGRNAYTTKTWMFSSRAEQIKFEATLLLFAAKSEELVDDALHFVNQQLEFCAFPDDLTLDEVFQIYKDVSDGKQIFELCSQNICNLNNYCNQSLDRQQFKLFLRGNKAIVRKTESRQAKLKKDDGDQIQFQHVCDICGSGFEKTIRLREHLAKCHNISLESNDAVKKAKIPFQCPLCEKDFESSFHSIQHFNRVHERRMRFDCEHCYKSFFDKHDLERHLRTHNGDKPFECDWCDKSFSTKGNLKQHVDSVHKGKKRKTCVFCLAKFSSVGGLNYHLLSHIGEKPDFCKECGREFNGSSHLKDHIRIHTGEKKFVCGECGKAFNQRAGLQLHKRIHSDELPYVCDVCSKGFRHKGNLTAHKRIHTGEKPYVCDVCSRAFADQSAFKKHVRRIHTADKKQTKK